jgi:hypothetical protein
MTFVSKTVFVAIREMHVQVQIFCSVFFKRRQMSYSNSQSTDIQPFDIIRKTVSVRNSRTAILLEYKSA